MVKPQIPDRGDIYHLDLTPSAGREQRGKHYAVILSSRSYNLTHLPYAAPITTVGSASRSAGTYVSLSGAGTAVTGIIQLDQVRSFDFRARGATKTGERVPDVLMDDVLSRFVAIFDGN